MKRLEGQPFDQWRLRGPAILDMYGSDGDATCGAFRAALSTGVTALVIAAAGEGWDHVSVSILGAARCPTWEEMCAVKEAFFRRDEWVMQLHPPQRDNVNVHPYCLHLWRPQYAEIPLPDPAMVGAGTTAKARSIVRV